MKKRSLLIYAATAAALCITGLSSLDFAFSRHGITGKGPADEAQLIIGCLAGDGNLEETLKNFPTGKGVDIVFASAFDKGLALQQCAAYVIDQQLIKRGIWTQYADFFNDFQNDTPVLVVDRIRDWGLPELM